MEVIRKLKYIVVGTGRCGTVSTAKFLSSVGIPCGHECVFARWGMPHALRILKGDIEWKNSEVSRDTGLKPNDIIVADSSWMAAPFLNHSLFEETKIIHVVRNPIDVILSYNNKLQYWHHPPWDHWHNYILNHCGKPDIPVNLIEQTTPLARNIYYVINWNRLIEKKAKNNEYVRIRIEHDRDKLIDFLHLSEPPAAEFERMNTYEEVEKRRLERRKINPKYGIRSPIASPPLEHPATIEDVMKHPLAEKIKELQNDYEYN